MALDDMARYKHCVGCVHFYVSRNTVGEKYRACIYILHTHKRRPCPAGEGCTVRELKSGSGRDAMRQIIAHDCASAAYDGKSKI